jgi:hypothetical protein
MTNHQRVGAISNAHAGREFEDQACVFFAKTEGLNLQRNLSVPLGIGSLKKAHAFDLGSQAPPVIVECKSHNWTETGNMPSAKVTVWNEAMYFFHLAPPHFRKVLFVLWASHATKKETLAQYYLRLYSHLIPQGVSVIEYNPTTGQSRQLPGAAQ